MDVRQKLKQFTSRAAAIGGVAHAALGGLAAAAHAQATKTVAVIEGSAAAGVARLLHAAGQPTILTGDTIHHYHPSKEPVVQPDGSLGRYNEHDNETVLVERSLIGGLVVGEGTFKNSYFKPASLRFIGDKVGATIGHMHVSASFMVGTTQGYEPDQAPNFRWAGKPVFPLVAVGFAISKDQPDGAKVGVEKIYTPMFETALKTISLPLTP